MRKLILGSVCVSAISLLTACNPSDISQQAATPTTETASPAVSKVAAAVKQELSSGIDFENFDSSVRPQDDFYTYVNGAWINNAEIPGDQVSIGAFYDLREQAQQDVKTIIEEVAATPNLTPGSDEQKVADLYRAYMDVATIDKLGVTPLKPYFAEINAIASPSQLMSYFAQSQIMGGGTPFAFYINADAKDSTRYAAHIWQAGLSLPDRDYYLSAEPRYLEIRAAYLAHIAKMFTLAGLANPEESAKQVLALETDIAKLHWDKVETRDSTKTYNLVATKDLATLSPSIDWQAYLTALGVDKQGQIIINQPSFITGMGKLINQDTLPEWKTYLTWQLLTQFASDLSTPLNDENFAFFSKSLNGQAEPKPRWKLGVDNVNGVLGEIVGKIYIKRHFTPEAKQRMQQLVENLRSAYGQSIDELTWMSPETKVAAKEKLAKFNPKIGYPDQWRDYSALTISASDLVGNIVNANRLNHQLELEKLGGPIRKWEWFMTPQTVNAYYNPTMNEIVFPAAILQPPFFSMDADDAVNYGGIGAVIGHEMGHGFDDQGAKFDGDGNLKDWWTEKDLVEFTLRGNALIKQYNGYKVFDDLHVNGELTLGENIGDLSGVTIAYKAYQMSLNNQQAPVIDGLSGNERFFIGFSQIWRSKLKDEAMRNRVATDPHSPGKFRAIGSLANMPEFYQTFDVKPGDGMYLPDDQRVKIW